MRHIPNILTILRLLATPVIVWKILTRDLDTALILFFLSGLTDTIDGTLARRFHWHSRLGQILDPIADKTLLAAGFLSVGWIGEIPPWVIFIVLVRDLGILLIALFLKRSGKIEEFKPSVWGKLSTFVQLLTVGSVLLRWPADRSVFYFATALLVFVSAFDYARQMRQKLN